MKKLITTLALATVCVGAMAQGNINFVNDSLHRYYMAPATETLKAADAGLAGLRTPVNGVLPSGATLVVDLFAGTSAGSLAYATTTTMSAIGPGSQNGANIVIPSLTAGVAAFFQIQIRENSFANATLAQQGGGYYGFSSVFTAVPLGGIAYASLVNKATPVFSTWADGTYVIPSVTGFGAVSVQTAVVPEPSSMALAGLGAASLLIFRRRK
jgi:hypothetical protein